MNDFIALTYFVSSFRAPMAMGTSSLTRGRHLLIMT